MKSLNLEDKLKPKLYFQNFILATIVFSVLISDWIIGPFAISEFVIAFLIVIIIIYNRQLVKQLNYKLLLILSMFFLLHMVLQTLINSSFEPRIAIYGIIKIYFFTIFINLTYRFINECNLEFKFLKFLNYGAIISILVGVYITFSISLDLELPFEFFWRFTRTSSFSYQFKDTNIIRTRSLFSEPAHLGYFLLIVLCLNFFSVYKDKISSVFSLVIILGIISTLSYSSLVTLFVLILIKSIYVFKNKEINKDTLFNFAFYMIVVLLVIYLFRDFLYVTFLERTMQMIEGIDNSAQNRIVESWAYVNGDNFILGNGIGHTPSVQNVYAYFLSDMGIVIFLLSALFSLKLITINIGFGALFIMLNFQKGGYLSPIFTLLILLIIVFINWNKYIQMNSHKLKRKYG